MNNNSEDVAERLKKKWTGPIGLQELAFLHDLQRFIEFAIENGLSFPMVMSALGHDVNEILRHGLNLDEAMANGFRPQTTGYHDLDANSFGENEEEAVSQ